MFSFGVKKFFQRILNKKIKYLCVLKNFLLMNAAPFHCSVASFPVTKYVSMQCVKVKTSAWKEMSGGFCPYRLTKIFFFGFFSSKDDFSLEMLESVAGDGGPTSNRGGGL
jgi:hypothetical protein